MKKFLTLIACAVFSTVASFAQLTSGHVSYDVEITSDDPDMAMAVMMFSDSKMNLYFGNDIARAEVDMGTMMSMTTVVDSKTEETLLLFGGMMGDKAVRMNTEQLEEDEEEGEEPTITLTNETKKILGYTCKKAIITDADGNGMDYWYAVDIQTIITERKSPVAKLPGLALEYSMDRDGMLMTFTATKVETSLDNATMKSKLSLEIPDGYEVMTYEEFISIGGGI